MTNRLLTLLASAAILSAATLALPGDATAAQKFQRLPAKGTVLKQKSGYYIQCYYSGLGEICEYVYARVKTSNGAKLQRVKVANGPLKHKLGYYTQCYYSALGEQCVTVYMKPRKK